MRFRHLATERPILFYRVYDDEAKTIFLYFSFQYNCNFSKYCDTIEYFIFQILLPDTPIAKKIKNETENLNKKKI